MQRPDFDPLSDFSPEAIPGEALADLRRLVVSRVLSSAPEFGGWLHHWIDTEQAIRAGVAQRTLRHGVAMPPAGQWSNRDLGQALRALNVLSFLQMPLMLGLFVDRLALGLGEEAARRLEIQGGKETQ